MHLYKYSIERPCNSCTDDWRRKLHERGSRLDFSYCSRKFLKRENGKGDQLSPNCQATVCSPRRRRWSISSGGRSTPSDYQESPSRPWNTSNPANGTALGRKPPSSEASGQSTLPSQKYAAGKHVPSPQAKCLSLQSPCSRSGLGARVSVKRLKSSKSPSGAGSTVFYTFLLLSIHSLSLSLSSFFFPVKK